MGNGDMVRGLGNHLVDRRHSPGVKVTADGEFRVLGILLCGFNATEIGQPVYSWRRNGGGK